MEGVTPLFFFTRTNGQMTYTISTSTDSSVSGAAATPENIARLELIAANQTVSTVTDPRYYEDINFEPDFYKALPSEPEKVLLETYMAKATEFFSPAMREVSEDEEDAYMEWASELIIYCAKRLCSSTQAEVGAVFGLSKGQVKAISERIERKLMKQSRKNDFTLLEFLNEFRLSLLAD